MCSCCRRRRCCWRLPFPGFLLLQLFLAPGPGTAATYNRCDTMYKGFADCLMSLGNSMAQSGQPQSDEKAGLTPPELESICRSWENFQTCASGVLANCPQEATAIWESLQQEFRKVQYQGNLHDLCSSPPFPPSNVRGAASEETNQETLQGPSAPASPAPAPAPALLAAALALACILGPLA
ncbi:neuritin-like protein [Monodelphis domestica]|uniref:neuritin-like protein n=1 Tax=Monodelphis domestica TaxID=13616 RepID=UPI0024E1BACA|nr:neuritin-like protein [Monodelphis domestica]